MNMRLLLDPAVSGATGGGTTPAAAAPAATPPVAPAATPAAAAPAAPAKADDKTPSFLAPPAAKPAEPAKPAVVEKYSLKVPEGQSMEAAAREAFEARMQALGVTQPAAQSLLDQQFADQKASYEKTVSQIDAQDKTWKGDLQTRWGEKFAENDAKLKVVFDYIDPAGDLRKGLADMRMAYNPTLIKAFERLIPLFDSPTLKAPAAAAPPAEDTRSQRERLTAHYEKSMKAAGVAPK